MFIKTDYKLQNFHWQYHEANISRESQIQAHNFEKRINFVLHIKLMEIILIVLKNETSIKKFLFKRMIYLDINLNSLSSQKILHRFYKKIYALFTTDKNKLEKGLSVQLILWHKAIRIGFKLKSEIYKKISRIFKNALWYHK